MKGNVINLNTLHLNSVRLNGIGKVQSVSLKGGSTEDPVFPPVEPEPTPTYTLSASVTNGMVSATRNGSAVNLPFTANEGDVIVVSVTPNDGYAFEGWADGNTDNPRSITMNADVALSAQCVEVVQPPVGKYIQFEDAEVERVLMSKGVSSDGVGITMEDAAKVTSIGQWFRGNTAITSFEEFKYFKNCTTLEASAFEGCTALATLPIGHIVVLKNKALCGCTALEYDYLDLANLTTLGQNALYGVKVKKLNVGEITILPSATTATQNFGDKSVLEEIILPNGISTIPVYGFYKYEALRVCDLPSTITHIAELAFHNVGVESVKADGLVTLDKNAYAGCSSMKTAEFGGNIATIAYRALYNCTALESIIVRATTPPTLDASAFTNTNNCPIYVPDASLEAYKTATNWNQYADRIHPLSEIEGSPYIQFEDAEVERVLMANGVSSDGIGITKEDAAAVTTIGTWFRGNTAITSFEELKHFGITQLVEESFRNCTNLQIIALPQKATRIDSYSFNGCSALTTIKAEGVSYIGNVAFIGCSLEKANFPNLTETIKWRDAGVVSVVNLGKLTTLPYEMFCYCGKLKYCILPSSLTGSNGDAFYGAGSIEVIIAKSTTPPSFNGGDFVGVPDDTKIYVPTASVDSYKAADAWSSRSGNIFPISNLATDNPTLYAEIQQYL